MVMGWWSAFRVGGVRRCGPACDRTPSTAEPFGARWPIRTRIDVGVVTSRQRMSAGPAYAARIVTDTSLRCAAVTTARDDREGECTELLQQLIRNACVNDGRSSPGSEVRSADLLATYLEGTALDIETYEPEPGPHEPRRPHRGHATPRRRRCC